MNPGFQSIDHDRNWLMQSGPTESDYRAMLSISELQMFRRTGAGLNANERRRLATADFGERYRLRFVPEREKIEGKEVQRDHERRRTA